MPQRHLCLTRSVLPPRDSSSVDLCSKHTLRALPNVQATKAPTTTVQYLNLEHKSTEVAAGRRAGEPAVVVVKVRWCPPSMWSGRVRCAPGAPSGSALSLPTGVLASCKPARPLPLQPPLHAELQIQLRVVGVRGFLHHHHPQGARYRNVTLLEPTRAQAKKQQLATEDQKKAEVACSPQACFSLGVWWSPRLARH